MDAGEFCRMALTLIRPTVWMLGNFAGWRFAYQAYRTIGITECRPDKA